MRGRVDMNFYIPTFIQSLFIFDYRYNLTSLYHFFYLTIKCYLKCYKRRSKYPCPLFRLPSNQFTRFFINTILCVAMATSLVTDILQNVWLCVADYN